MDEGLYTREPRDEASSDTERVRTHATKLKNKDSARRYYEKKLRNGKADNRDSAEEQMRKEKIHKQSQKKANEIEKKRKNAEAKKKADQNARKGSELSRNAVSKVGAAAGMVTDVIGSAQEDSKDESSVAEEVVESGGYIASGAVSSATSKVKNKKYSNKMHGRKELSAEKEAARRKAQREMQRKAMEKQARAAENGGKIGRKITDKAEDLAALLWETVKEFVEDNPVTAAIIVLVLILIIALMGLLGSCSAMGGGGGDVIMGTSYTATDEDILGTEDDYKDLEEGLQDDIDNIKSDYPDYDEYNYYLDEIGHNPYQLAAILTVLYEAYKRENVQAKIQEIFDIQYELTVEEVVEIREREVEDTRWVEDDSYAEGGYWEDYTYTEEYEYYILNVYLVNKTLDVVPDELGMTDAEKQRVALLLYTFGNRKYLFGDEDIYNLPGEGDEGSHDHRVPGEYLSDEQFTRMLAEAERYLDVPYVWGGYSPSGFDCSGFVSYVINHCGNGWNYGRLTANGLRARTANVPASEAKPGDLIFFQGTYATSGASHVGIYVGGGWMIHAGNPVHYSNINTPYWQSHFLGYGRIQ
ncbi:MAG: NlpC/P60 family protein [Butyrivibrio sp.]|uniref:C40 family peptidase n=1 Tax=Butyrivibrio sp. TaxID=28121 RepID=UPI001EB307BA|nr:C40 family peptidase [Butyrivibrio sp.]MBE5841316.1 NlpC/P60 family protein [Butyrivibrio sp.]